MLHMDRCLHYQIKSLNQEIKIIEPWNKGQGELQVVPAPD